MTGRTLLNIVKGANTGELVWETAGPLIQHLMEAGKEADEVVTDEELKQASIDLGQDLSDLDAAISRKEARDRG